MKTIYLSVVVEEASVATTIEDNIRKSGLVVDSKILGGHKEALRHLLHCEVCQLRMRGNIVPYCPEHGPRPIERGDNLTRILLRGIWVILPTSFLKGRA